MNVAVEGVEFAYDSRPVLSDVTFQVESGELVSVVGPNGSGKSTLLRVVNRILTPDAGSVLVDGRDVAGFSRGEIAKTFGYVPQDQGGGFPTTVFDTVLMGRKPHIDWRPTDHDLEIVSSVLERLELQELAMRDVGELSGGQRQKVVMARAIAQEPAVLLLDEPTSSLDLKHQLQVLDIAREETDAGVATFLVIHDLNLAARYSDKVLLLDDGKVHAAGGVEVLSPNTSNPSTTSRSASGTARGRPSSCRSRRAAPTGPSARRRSRPGQ
ncbi:ABC transporter ATP-binding protein [Halobacteriaceae archaeon GCM10025711]